VSETLDALLVDARHLSSARTTRRTSRRSPWCSGRS
jgi:hypothetical protein